MIYSGDLPDSLTDLLPETDPEPFTSRRYDEDLQDLSDDTEVEQQQFYARLLQFVNQLRAQIQANLSEVDSIDVFIAPYVTEDVRRVTEEGVAMLAIVFNELENDFQHGPTHENTSLMESGPSDLPPAAQE